MQLTSKFSCKQHLQFSIQINILVVDNLACWAQHSVLTPNWQREVVRHCFYITVWNSQRCLEIELYHHKMEFWPLSITQFDGNIMNTCSEPVSFLTQQFIIVDASKPLPLADSPSLYTFLSTSLVSFYCTIEDYSEVISQAFSPSPTSTVQLLLIFVTSWDAHCPTVTWTLMGPPLNQLDRSFFPSFSTTNLRPLHGDLLDLTYKKSINL